MNANLRIHVYSICWNAEKILPHFLRHYRQWAERITIFDNMSTDNSREILHGADAVEVRDFDTAGQIDEAGYLQIKNHAYKGSCGLADFVVVVDIDEFLYHPFLAEVLYQCKADGVTLPHVDGYNMVSFLHPWRNTDIVSSVRRGRPSPQYSKRCVFAPELDINYLPGAHRCFPRGNVVESGDLRLKLLHYHYLGLATVLTRYRAYQGRVQAQNIRLGYGIQYSRGLFFVAGRFLKNWILARPVL